MATKMHFFIVPILLVLGTAVAVEYISLGPFSFSDTQLSWAESRQACIESGKSLVSIDSREKDEQLLDLLLENGNGEIQNATAIMGQSWSSGTELQEGVWNWDSTGRPLFYTRWFVGQPDDLTSLNCIYLATSGKANLYWRDANCSAAMYYILPKHKSDKISVLGWDTSGTAKSSSDQNVEIREIFPWTGGRE